MLIDASTGRSLTAALGALVTVAPASRIKGHARVSVAALHDTVLWLLVASGSLVLIEPSPYEALFAVAIVVFGASLRFDRSFVPLVLCLILFNLGGLLSLIPWTDDHDSVTFLFTSAYVSATAIFFACVTAERSLERLEIIRRAYIVAAVIGSVAGIAGYFDIGGLGDVFTKFDRATGTFKDPNVLGPFTVLALVWISQRILVGEIRRGTIAMATTILSFMIIAFALFLTFSRGAWGVCIASFLLMFGLTFLTAPSKRLRARIALLAVLGVAAVATLLAIALSFQSIRDIFDIRATFSQDYDLGETGRFGNQLRALPMLLVSPNGFGPLQFRHLFAEEDPHNVYVNAFASYGWLGGFAYCTLTVMTVCVGWWLVFRRSPTQKHAIALWSCLFVQILQGFQIDTDHWRHLFLMLGCVWGLAAATRRTLSR
ncbi:MAG: O-antigen ligase family protein [Methylobacteriaceae bacterium]|nr:O-antigen ligase family protein [Methylobacteriaceae bacterium]